MKLSDLKTIKPMLSVKEHDLLKSADTLHQDPSIHTDPSKKKMIDHLMKLGYMRKLRGDIEQYEVTDQGKELT
jgi:hypothetical protein